MFADHGHHYRLAGGQAFLDEWAEDRGELPPITPQESLVAVTLP
jgi:hypothetical protein